MVELGLCQTRYLSMHPSPGRVEGRVLSRAPAGSGARSWGLCHRGRLAAVASCVLSPPGPPKLPLALGVESSCLPGAQLLTACAPP